MHVTEWLGTHKHVTVNFLIYTLIFFIVKGFNRHDHDKGFSILNLRSIENISHNTCMSI